VHGYALATAYTYALNAAKCLCFSYSNGNFNKIDEVMAPPANAQEPSFAERA